MSRAPAREISPVPLVQTPKPPMPKKTADKKSGDKKANAGKDAGDSKVRSFSSVCVHLGSMGTIQGGGKLKAATSVNVRHILCEVG